MPSAEGRGPAFYVKSLCGVSCCHPGVVLHYTRFKEIAEDISDARIFGGIHFRFDQEAGADLGRDIGSYVYKHNLRDAKHADRDDDGDRDDRRERSSRRRN
jgi:hypothetical protein